MTIRITGPGVGFPAPANLYPTDLQNAPLDLGNAFVGLAAGESIPLPAGDFLVQPGGYSLLQWLDPISGVWRSYETQRGQEIDLFSPGFSMRLANLTGCPVAAVVAGGGTGFSQASAQITPNIGGSTWQAVVGGSLTVSSIVNPGAGFTIRPNVLIPDPPPAAVNGVGGVQATALATITNGTVSAVSLPNVGAGYTSPTIAALIVPSPYDPNFGSITNGTVLFTLTNSGLITAALCTNNGAPLTNAQVASGALTLTAAGGGGSGATITPVIMQSVVSAGIVAGGVAFGNATNPALITSVGGMPVSVSAIGNPAIELTGARPRAFVASGTANAAGTITGVNIQDRGLFFGTPSIIVIPGGGIIGTTGASITVVMGAVDDTVYLQPK
jgi:hypothetical protein